MIRLPEGTGSVVIFWFRRDLRLNDNRGLVNALKSDVPVLPLFIYDTSILERLESDDKRVAFISDTISSLHNELSLMGSGMVTLHGDPLALFKEILSSVDVKAVYVNRDYEPLSLLRDKKIESLLSGRGIPFLSYSDQLIFEPGEVMKADGTPYTVFTPFLKKWMSLFNTAMISEEPVNKYKYNFIRNTDFDPPLSKESIGFGKAENNIRPLSLEKETIVNYHTLRDIPAADATSHAGPHLRFGTIGIREVARRTTGLSTTFTAELIWREFFMHILSFFPKVTERSFRPQYNRMEWINDEYQFHLWCTGKTGYPLVDAGMRELMATGYMHNRVRMVCASFLTKHLLTDWRHGEVWFANKLSDYELASNNGNWQWAAGTGCDAAPYFRVFSPEAQQKKYDSKYEYIRKWVAEYGTPDYPDRIVDHRYARERAITEYKKISKSIK